MGHGNCVDSAHDRQPIGDKILGNLVNSINLKHRSSSPVNKLQEQNEMTLPHDSAARLTMLNLTIKLNEKRLVDHDAELERPRRENS